MFLRFFLPDQVGQHGENGLLLGIPSTGKQATVTPSSSVSGSGVPRAGLIKKRAPACRKIVLVLSHCLTLEAFL